METYYEKYKRRIGELDAVRQDIDEREKEIVRDFTAEREQFRASAPNDSHYGAGLLVGTKTLLKAARIARRAIALTQPTLKDPKRGTLVLEELDAALQLFQEDEETHNA